MVARVLAASIYGDLAFDGSRAAEDSHYRRKEGSSEVSADLSSR